MNDPTPLAPLDACLNEAISRFKDNNPGSLEQHERAMRCMPGGNTRSILFTEPFPIALVAGREALVISLDGREYGIWQARRGMLNLSLPMIDVHFRRLIPALDDFIIARCELFH